MRFLILRSGDPPRHGRPADAFVEAMRAFDDDLRAAGVVLAVEDLHPGGPGTRLRFESGRAPTILEGPYDGSTDAIRGFYILQVRSEEDARAWARRCPLDLALVDGAHADLEIRQIADGPGW